MAWILQAVGVFDGGVAVGGHNQHNPVLRRGADVDDFDAFRRWPGGGAADDFRVRGGGAERIDIRFRVAVFGYAVVIPHYCRIHARDIRNVQ